MDYKLDKQLCLVAKGCWYCHSSFTHKKSAVLRYSGGPRASHRVTDEAGRPQCCGKLINRASTSSYQWGRPAQAIAKDEKHLETRSHSSYL